MKFTKIIYPEAFPNMPLMITCFGTEIAFKTALMDILLEYAEESGVQVMDVSIAEDYANRIEDLYDA